MLHRHLFKNRAIRASAVMIAMFVISNLAHGGAILFVDDDAPPGGDGTTWKTAYRFLQDALADASGGGVTEVHVGQGTYKPDRDEANPKGTGDRDATFQLINNVAVMGGYAGIGADDPDAHNIELFETILSGDLLGNDGPNFQNYDENSLHVVTGSGVMATAGLDGFSITAGNANSKAPFKRGAGMFNEISSAVVSHCIFRKHIAQRGAAVSNAGGSPTFENCVFIDNLASGGAAMENRQNTRAQVFNSVFAANTVSHSGGAVFINESSFTTFVGCDFVANSATEANSVGGAMALSDCDLVFINCNFTENIADGTGGAITAFDCNIDFTGCTFTDNSAGDVGALNFIGLSISLNLANCQFINNTSLENGGAVSCRAQQFAAVDCVFSGNSAMNSQGGGLHLFDNEGLLLRCQFIDNSASGRGGGLSLREAEPLIIDCVFVGNSASEGGGLAIDPDSGVGGIPVIIGTSFFGNVASSRGGAVYERRSNTEPLFVNCRFNGNTSGLDGGAIHNNEQAQPTLVNCTVALNVAGGDGGGMNSEFGTQTIVNCIFWGNQDSEGSSELAQINGGSAVVNFCCIQNLTGKFGGVGNIGEDPLFVDADGPDDIPGTEDDDLRLSPGSPCIDAADNTAVPPDEFDLDDDGDTKEPIPFDLDGNPRFVDDPDTKDTGNGDPPIVDMGAYEFQGAGIIEASLDIKPGSCPNSFNRNSNGVLPVALVGTDDFDVTEVDLASILLVRTDGLGGSIAPHEGPPGPHSEFEDVATPFEGEEQCDCDELGGDGILDLSMKFKSANLVAALELDDLKAGDFVSLTLTGNLLDGTPFEAADCIRIVPPGDLPGLMSMESTAPGVFIDVTPLDETLDGGGFVDFKRSYVLGTIVTLTAPQTHPGWVFVGWDYDGGGLSSFTVTHQGGFGLQPDDRTIEIIVLDEFSLKAIYRPSMFLP